MSAEEDYKDLKKNIGVILDRLTKIETVLEMRADFDKRIRELEKDQAACRKHPVEDHENRIKELEHALALQKGQGKILAAIFGAVTSAAVSIAVGLILWAMKGN